MKKPSILLIDDDDSLRRVMEFSLVEAGYTVRAASSGENGLRLFEQEVCDAVVTDITMPGMSGMEVLARIREKDEQVPVIVITAYGTIESAVEAMKKWAFDYITKPFNRDELRMTLEKALTLRRLERENLELRAAVTDRYSLPASSGSSG
jgi:two-component system NtrC family response regulator